MNTGVAVPAGAQAVRITIPLITAVKNCFNVFLPIMVRCSSLLLCYSLNGNLQIRVPIFPHFGTAQCKPFPPSRPVSNLWSLISGPDTLRLRSTYARGVYPERSRRTQRELPLTNYYTIPSFPSSRSESAFLKSHTPHESDSPDSANN